MEVDNVPLVLWFPVILLVSALLFIVALTVDMAMEERSPFYPYKKIKYYNKLYKCKSNNCNRMFRRYQLDLYYTKHNKDCCPHCEYSVSTYRSSMGHEYDNIYTIQIIRPEKWMNEHQDCMKLNLIDLLKMTHTIKAMKKLELERKSLKEFEDYNKYKVDLKWIENLQKEKKS